MNAAEVITRFRAELDKDEETALLVPFLDMYLAAHPQSEGVVAMADGLFTAYGRARGWRFE